MLSALLNWFIGSLGQNTSNTQFLHSPARKESNVTKLKSSQGLTVLLNILCCLVEKAIIITRSSFEPENFRPVQSN